MFDEFLCKHIHKRTIRVRDVVIKAIKELSSSLVLIVGCVSFFGIAFATMLTVGDIYYILKGYQFSEILNIGVLKVAFVGFEILLIPIALILIIYAVVKSINRVLDIEVAHCQLKDDEGEEDKEMET